MSATTRPAPDALARFRGAVALVAGDSTGLGRVLAWALADEGADVALVEVTDPGLRSVRHALPTAADLDDAVRGIRDRGRRATVSRLGTGDLEARARAVVDDAEHELGPIGVVVVAPRLLTVCPAERLDEDTWDDVVTVDLDGPFAVLRTVLPRMTARGAGRVVVVTGEEARLGAAGRSHVAAVGWAAIGLAKSLALEVADAGVRVNVVVAGPLDEPATADPAWGRAVTGHEERTAVEHELRVAHPISRAWVDPGDVADVVLHLAAPGGPEVTGAVVDVTLGTNARNSA
jgi:NAD(P)-dependent dehydrogenase (short-subunit alcohol dehydrogenase family)